MDTLTFPEDGDSAGKGGLIQCRVLAAPTSNLRHAGMKLGSRSSDTGYSTLPDVMPLK